MDTETGYAFTGDGVSGVYGYGVQAELGTGTSYIPTEGSTVTRNQDVCNNGGSLASINSDRGGYYIGRGSKVTRGKWHSSILGYPMVVELIELASKPLQLLIKLDL